MMSTLSDQAKKPVFCIIDPSLRDFVGNHFSYDYAISAAAELKGYRAVTLGHRATIAEVKAALNVQRCFRRDILDRHPWARAMGDAYGRFSFAGRAIDHALCSRDFATDLRTGLGRLDLPPGSVILGHMIVTKQMAGFVRTLGDLTRQGRDIMAILLLRYQAILYDNPFAARVLRRLEALVAAGGRIRLASDSGRLASEISRLTSLPVEVLSIPHGASTGPIQSKARAALQPVRFVSLGNARDEKGILDILEAIRILRAEPQGLSGLEFVLQANDPWPTSIEREIAEFAAVRPAEVTLLPAALNAAEYESTLTAADVLLLPYWRSICEARTSGVFLEAIAAGKPVIATRDTWMSDELAQHGAGLLVPERDPVALAAAIRRAACNFPSLAEKASADRSAVRARHSAAALVEQCAGMIAPLPNLPRPPRHIAIFYPWGDFGERRAGASRRTSLMLDVIAPMAGEVRVLHAGWPPDRSEGKVTTIAAPPRLRLHFARRVFRMAIRPLMGHNGWGQELVLWWYLERRFDPRFRRQVRDLVRWSDAVLLEYSFWAWAVIAECRRRKVPCVLTTHDVLNEQVTSSSLLRRLTLRQEVTALRAADHVVCVSDGDAATFSAHGIAATVIPNPADLDMADAPAPPIEARQLLETLFELRLSTGPICLFVGSDYPPNRVAVTHIRSLAKAMPPEAQATFVLVGGCAPAGRDGAVMALGRVEEVVLAALYRAAAVVVIPLTHGTGSSLKTVEAMGWGCPILGTATAFRGLPVTPGINCEQEDDLSRWPKLLAALLADPARRAAISTAGRRVAEARGHRRVFAAYLPLLGLAGGDDVCSDEANAAARRKRSLSELRVLLDRALARDKLEFAHDLIGALMRNKHEQI